MNQSTSNQRFFLLVGFTILAVLSRLLPHPPNFTPITGVALFSAAYFRPSWQGLAVVLGSMFISDLILGLHTSMWVVYFSFIIIFGIGKWMLQNKHMLSVLSASLLSSVVFYITTNLAVWVFSGLYTPDITGLITCFVAAIPFFGNTVLGDVVYSTFLFGSWYLMTKWKPSLA